MFVLTVPVQSKSKQNAEEEEDEDETYEPDSQDESETETSVEDEEEEENENERIIVSDDEEEISSETKAVKPKKDLSEELKKQVKKKPTKAPVKRKASPPEKPSKKVKRSASKNPENPGKKVVRKKTVKVSSKDDDDNDSCEENEKKTGKKKKDESEEVKKPTRVIEYNAKNIDYNLYNEAPEHIKQLKVQISSNIIMHSRMIEATAGANALGLSYDYAALSFQRNTKSGKAYEFNMPLNLAPCIIKGIQYLIKNNPKFFEKYVETKSTENTE